MCAFSRIGVSTAALSELGPEIPTRFGVLASISRTTGTASDRRACLSQRNADILFGVTTRSRRPELVDVWKPRWRELTGASVYWETSSWLRREDLTSRLGEISVPTLVIHGEEDVIIPTAAAEEMAKGVQNDRLVRVANAGHPRTWRSPMPSTQR
jgi:pimeloyl-ACP methyl ester carboxylesterase